MSPEEAERHLLSLELFGMRFGLDRMRRLMGALGHPERRFRSIHVVGTNGKSSTVRMAAAILARHGLRAGSYLSPHLVSFGERIRVDDEDLAPADFAAAITRAAAAAEQVDRTAAPEDRVTQFELLTAAAYDELARREVDVGVIEAGLGGRYDATNVIPSDVAVLTSVGLEHTRWLGPTVRDIAREKLDVVQPGSVLVLGAGLHPDARRVAETIAEEREARLVFADADPGVPLGALGAYQRRNFALARAAAGALLGELDTEAVASAATAVRVPGRLHVVGTDPLTVLDGAHNPDGVAALVESLHELRAGRGRLVVVVSILEDKDAAGMLRTILDAGDEVVFTTSRNPRALSAAALRSLADSLGGTRGDVVADPQSAVARARTLAGPDGVVVATGSIYLVAELLRPAGTKQVSML